MPNQSAKRVWTRALTPEDKAAITDRCDRYIATVLKPRFLPEIRPTPFNYPVDLLGKWRGSKYSVITRYRSGFPENRGEEFDAPFARLDHVAGGTGGHRFNVMWLRHTGKWWCLHGPVTLDDALRLIETEPLLQPV